MSRRTRDALASVGLEADGHRSHQLTDGDVEDADLILAMAGEHVAFIRRRYPAAASQDGIDQAAVPRPAPGPGTSGRADRLPRPGRHDHRSLGGRGRSRPVARTRPTWPVPTSWPSLAAALLPRLG